MLPLPQVEALSGRRDVGDPLRASVLRPPLQTEAAELEGSCAGCCPSGPRIGRVVYVVLRSLIVCTHPRAEDRSWLGGGGQVALYSRGLQMVSPTATRGAR